MKSIWQVLFCISIAASIFGCSDNNDSAGGATEGTNGLAIIDKEITGLTQKGPFVKGSPVTVLELSRDGYKQTGRAFRGKVGEKGFFKVNNLKLESNYAVLEANGYYLNEITGKTSESPITLNAVADLSGREQVNINLLTQIQYERVRHLAQDLGMDLVEAKQQSKKEILKAFYSDDDYDLEDMNIFGAENRDALLLAVSVMIQGELSVPELTELLYNLAIDLEENGEFNNDTLIAEIADHAAFDIDTDKIRRNILSWKFTDSLPNFEYYIKNFWTNEYKLGKCNKENDGAIKKNGNKVSYYTATQFLCKDGEWSPIYYNPDFEYGTITDKRDGQKYRTTKIGNQVWMAENMKYKPKGSNMLYSCYNDEERNCKIYGYLYGLDAALEACPEGFHLPTNEEWEELAEFLGGNSIAGAKLRAIGGWNTKQFPQTKDDKDKYGFSALPAGVYYYGSKGVATYFWTSNTIKGSDGSMGAMNVQINDTEKMYFGGNARATTQTSVRCLKGEPKPVEDKTEETEEEGQDETKE